MERCATQREFLQVEAIAGVRGSFQPRHQQRGACRRRCVNCRASLQIRDQIHFPQGRLRQESTAVRRGDATHALGVAIRDASAKTRRGHDSAPCSRVVVVVRASPMLVRVGVALSRSDSCELQY